MSKAPDGGFVGERAEEESRRDPRAHLRLGLEKQVRVVCGECGWRSRWYTERDLAWIAFSAHDRARHREQAA